MPTPRVNLEVNGIDLLDSYLEKLIAGIRDFKKFFPDVIDEYERKQNNWFDTQGEGSWEPLSPTYAAWKNTFAPGQPLLVLSGDLRTSAKDFDKTQTSDVLTIKANAPDYWIFHQFGTVKMPARPPFIIDDSLAEALGNALVSGIVRFMNGTK